MDFDGDVTVMAKALDWVPPPLVPEGPIDNDELAVAWVLDGAPGVQ
jgi:hypothetical protein